MATLVGVVCRCACAEGAHEPDNESARDERTAGVGSRDDDATHQRTDITRPAERQRTD